MKEVGLSKFELMLLQELNEHRELVQGHMQKLNAFIVNNTAEHRKISRQIGSLKLISAICGGAAATLISFIAYLISR